MHCSWEFAGKTFCPLFLSTSVFLVCHAAWLQSLQHGAGRRGLGCVFSFVQKLHALAPVCTRFQKILGQIMPSKYQATPLSRSSGGDRRPQHAQHLLPTPWSATLPSCAHRCLHRYIRQQFSCPNETLSCLCSTYSSLGFSLGELAYLCLNLDCPVPAHAASVSAYEVCIGKPHAVRPTHRTLTPPAAIASTTATSSMATSTFPSYSVLTTASASAQVTGISNNPSNPATPVDSALLLPASTSLLPAPTSTASHSHGSTALTPAEVVGVSIGSVAAVATVVAAIYCCLYARRRRKAGVLKRHDAHVLPVEEKLQYTEEKSSPLPVREVPAAFHIYAEPCLNTTPTIQQSRPSSSSSLLSMTGNHSPVSPETSVSTLLTAPFKPLPSPPTNPSTSVQEGRPLLRSSGSLRGHTPHLPSKAHTVLWQPAPPNAFSRYQVAVQPRTQGQSTNKARTVFSNTFRLPDLRALRAYDYASSASPSRAGSGKTVNSLLDYGDSISYSSHEAHPLPFEGPLQRITRLSHGATMRSAASAPIRKASVQSSSSDTTFESVDSNDITPPSDTQQLLPPISELPANPVQYPKVPRGSNQMVPRSPRPSVNPSLAAVQTSQSPRRGRFPVALPSHRERPPDTS